MTAPSPSELHAQARREYARSEVAARARYIELMIEHGHIIDVGPVFFGCRDQVGHEYSTLDSGWRTFLQFPTPFGGVDGQWTPKNNRGQSRAALHHRYGWTILAVHDYTIDKRPGSNSNFIVPNDVDFGEILAIAHGAWPKVVDRLLPIYLIEVDGEIVPTRYGVAGRGGVPDCRDVPPLVDDIKGGPS